MKDRKRIRRIKKIKHSVLPNEMIDVFYNPNLKDDLPSPELIFNTRSWGIWFKPSSVPVSPTPYSDKFSLETQVVQEFRQCHLINRMDFETEGLVIVAYTSKQAALLSEALGQDKISKYYLAEVLGKFDAKSEIGQIDLALDQKNALTQFQVLAEKPDSSIVLAKLITGRLHQIRRHFEMLGHPVIGDPKYGKNNENTEGLKLQCICYKLNIPNAPKQVVIPEEKIKAKFPGLDIKAIKFF